MGGSGQQWAPGRSGQPAHVLVAWLCELVDESRGALFPRFAQLREQLHSGEFRWECAPFGDAVIAWADAASRLELKANRPRGLWASLTGNAERRRREVDERVAQVAAAAALVREELPLFESACRTQLASRKMLVELEFERKALIEQLEPATGWLAEVAAAMSAGSDVHAAAWAAAADRAAMLPREIKRLHEVAASVEALSALGLKIVAKRSEALACARDLLRDFESTWTPRVSRRPGRPEAVLDPAAGLLVPVTATHEDLVQRLDALGQLLHEVEVESADMDRRLWELAELLA